MSELILIRHGETALAGTFCGRSDPELNERGRGQAAGIADALADVWPGAIHASDLRRARQTAETLAAVKAVEVRALSGLREIDFGLWEGLRWSEIEARDGEHAARWLAEFPRLPAPSGESFAAFEDRVIGCVSAILKGELSTGVPRPVAIVSHGGVMRVVLERLCGWSQTDAWARTKSYGCVIRLPLVEVQLAHQLDETESVSARRAAPILAVR